jgi:hypothetical protein
MTIAAEIAHECRNANHADRRAADMAVEVDQDWEHEATLYTFADRSVMLITGPQVNTYASMADARAALEA